MKRGVQENSTCRAALLGINKISRQIESISLQVEQVSGAINSLIQRENGQRKETEEKILTNVNAIVLPCLNELKKTSLDTQQAACVDLAEKHLLEILSPFVNTVTSKCLSLSPREIQVANLVKEGKTSKEIASLMNVSSEAVDIHRNHIRKKLGLSNRKVNLQAYLMTFLNGDLRL